MNYCKAIPTLLVLIISALSLTSCTEGVVGTVQLSVSATGNTSFTSGRPAIHHRTEAEVMITDFQLSIRDVSLELEAIENDNDSTETEDSTEIKFAGPFVLDLLDDTDVLTQSLGAVDFPQGVYEEVDLVLHKTRDVATDHPLYDRSIYLAGTIDGIPFEMWHDTSENLEIEYAEGVTVDEMGAGITITFSVDQFMNSLHQIDLSQAQDGNGDGLIEINPNDPDGNKELADLLKENIKEAADLLED